MKTLNKMKIMNGNKVSGGPLPCFAKKIQLRLAYQGFSSESEEVALKMREDFGSEEEEEEEAAGGIVKWQEPAY